MNGGSDFQSWLDDHAANPKPIQRTDWTTIGSDDDNHVASDSATGMGANSTKVIDTTDSNIEHADFLDATRAVNDASVIYRQPGATGSPGTGGRSGGLNRACSRTISEEPGAPRQ
jgi:hypothetical protein